MAGIYIHIPFCKQACNYCNFHFSTSLRYKNELIAALLKEVTLVNANPADPIETIYFGGGTPSICSAGEISSILSSIRQKFPVGPQAEITLEANPDDIHPDKLLAWQAAGINRLSMGIQSFFQDDLQWMNRAHNQQQALEGLKTALLYFNNISIDLIYGTPGLTDEKWKQNVDQAIALGVPHISCYALTVEPKTPLQKLIKLHKKEDIDPDTQSRQFLLLMEWLTAAGYEHYEISNFAKPGFRSRHNSSYWQGKHYTGLGPSAHSFDGRSRWWNIASNSSYIQSIEKGILPFEKEELSPVQRINEFIMISLRTLEGLDTNRLENSNPYSLAWGMDDKQVRLILENMKRQTQKYVTRGQAIWNDDRLQLTNEGKLMADGIAADLFVED